MKTKINKENFYFETFADFKNVSKEILPKLGIPHFISESGSKYWYTNFGVYRLSTHWGEAASCVWALNGYSYRHEALGYCKFKDFKSIEWDALICAGEDELEDFAATSQIYKDLLAYKYCYIANVNLVAFKDFKMNVDVSGEISYGTVKFNCLDFHPNHFGEFAVFKILD